MKEEEIRPKDIFDKYLELSLEDSKNFNKKELVSINCPACNSELFNDWCSKNGFSFSKCQSCNTLFCNPRPSHYQLNELYKNSKSADFWSKEFFPAVAEKRRSKIFKPRAKKILELVKEKGIRIEKVCDVGAGYGILLEELKSVDSSLDCYAIEPGEELSQICIEKGIETLRETCENSHEWSGLFDLVVCSEVIEHVFSPLDFIGSLRRLVKKNGHCLITGLGFEGYDILTLKEKSNSLFPPHHINFMSIKGFEEVFTRAGFSSLEVFTPGELDVDIVLNSGLSDEFLNVLSSRGEEALKKFQEFLVEQKMSSHIWVLAKN